MEILVPALFLLIGVLAGVLGTLVWVRRAEPIDLGGESTLIRDGLERLHDRMRDLEHQRVSWQSTLHQQVDEVRHSTDTLRRETSALANALRKPHVRGQWGELHLRRAVELAGLVDRCDFEEQMHLPGTDPSQTRLRPDLVVSLAGGKSIVVDAKVPLAAFLDAQSAEDADEQATHLAHHARQVRAHIEQLSSKKYWEALTRSGQRSPEFVVLFLPAESFLASALEADSTLLEFSAERQVVLASPTTLIALLRTVAHGWTTEVLAERTHEIHELGRELYGRLRTVGGHVDKLGRSLKASVESYNSMVGSLESRVLVTARHFADVAETGVGTNASWGPLQPVAEGPRPLTAYELLEAVADPRPELVDLGEVDHTAGDGVPPSRAGRSHLR